MPESGAPLLLSPALAGADPVVVDLVVGIVAVAPPPAVEGSVVTSPAVVETLRAGPVVASSSPPQAPNASAVVAAAIAIARLIAAHDRGKARPNGNFARKLGASLLAAASAPSATIAA